VISAPKEIMSKMKKKFPEYMKHDSDVYTRNSENERTRTMKEKLDNIFDNRKGNYSSKSFKL
jgi:hypothetical protein